MVVESDGLGEGHVGQQDGAEKFSLWLLPISTLNSVEKMQWENYLASFCTFSVLSNRARLAKLTHETEPIVCFIRVVSRVNILPHLGALLCFLLLCSKHSGTPRACLVLFCSLSSASSWVCERGPCGHPCRGWGESFVCSADLLSPGVTD